MPFVLSFGLSTSFAINEFYWDLNYWNNGTSGYYYNASEVIRNRDGITSNTQRAHIGSQISSNHFTASTVEKYSHNMPKNFLENICFGNNFCENVIGGILNDDNIVDNICFGNERCKDYVDNYFEDNKVFNIPGVYGMRNPAFYLMCGSPLVFIAHSFAYNRVRRKKEIEEH